MVIFFIMNLIVGMTAFLVNYKMLKPGNFLDSLIALIILYFAEIVSIEVLLGILGVLNLSNIILLSLFLLLAVWVITRNKKFTFAISGFKETSAEIFGNKAALFAVSIILGFGLTKIFINLVNPAFGWDSLNYHFVFPVEWLKHGNLDNPITISDDPSPSYYPINGSLFFFWLMLPFRNVFLADLGQAPFFILAFLSVFSISRKIWLNRQLSFYASSLFFITPNFFKQLSYGYVDVMVAALFLACVNFLFSLKERFSPVNVLIYSASLGLFLGTKTVALPYSILLFIPFIYLMFKNINRSYLFVITITSVVILGGFSYIRNFIITGNPLYPLDLEVFGNAFLKGVMNSGVYRAHFKIEDYSLSKLLFHEGLGVQAVIFILPAVFLALPAVFMKKRKSLDFNLIYFLILPALVYLAYRYIIPLANTRYLYPFLGIGIITGFYTAKVLGIPKAVINVLTVICSLASMFELAKRQELVFSIILTLLLFFLLPILIKRVKSMIKPLTVAITCVLILFPLILLEKNYVKNEFKRYIKMVKYSGFWPDAVKAWDWLNSNTQGNNIAYIGRPVPFPLYGDNFKNNVYYVSVNRTDPAKLHYFANSHYEWGYDFLSLHKDLEIDGNYRAHADYSVWLGNLLKRDTDFLFIYSLHQTKETKFPVEYDWAKDNPGRFTQVFANQTIHIYKILK